MRERLFSVMAFRLSHFSPQYFLILCMYVQVRARDNGSPPRFTDHSLTVNIMDVNDNAPVVQSPRGYNVSVSEVSVTQPANQTTSGPWGLKAGSKSLWAKTRHFVCLLINMLYSNENWDEDIIQYIIENVCVFNFSRLVSSEFYICVSRNLPAAS